MTLIYMTFDCQFCVKFVSRLLKAVLSSTRYLRNCLWEVASSFSEYPTRLFTFGNQPNRWNSPGKRKSLCNQHFFVVNVLPLPFHCRFILQARNDHPTYIPWTIDPLFSCFTCHLPVSTCCRHSNDQTHIFCRF